MLSQDEAESLLALPKRQEGNESFEFPGHIGGKASIPLESFNRREKFSLDINNSTMNLAKITYQARGRSVIVLARLDLGGAPHKNPNGEEFPCPHLHLYREGYADKWAFPVPNDKFSELSDFWVTFEEFCRYITVVEKLKIARGLFS